MTQAGAGPPPERADAPPERFDLVIEAGCPGGGYWRDLWHHRELFWFLSWRDVLARYKQTAIGVAWSLVRPFVTMVVFTAVFGRIARLPSGDAPYPVMVYAALLPWQLFANALSQCSASLLGNAGLLTKVYFPRIIAPGSAVLVSLVDFLISLAFLAGLMAWYGHAPGPGVLALPLLLLLALAASLGGGLLLASLSVRYRDFHHLLPFVVQAGLFLSPVGFSSAVVPEPWQALYALNPMVGVIDGFRWALLGGGFAFPAAALALSGAVSALLLWGGVRRFRETERTFADVI